MKTKNTTKDSKNPQLTKEQEQLKFAIEAALNRNPKPTKEDKEQYSEEEMGQKTQMLLSNQEYERLCDEVFDSLSENEWLNLSSEDLDQRIYALKRKKEKARAVLDSAFEKTQAPFSPVLYQTARDLLSAIRQKKFKAILDILDRLSLPSGFSLEIEEKEQLPGRRGSNSEILLKNKVGDCLDVDQLWDYILVENSLPGVWQAYLLYRVEHSLPLWGHARYDSRSYLYAAGDEKWIAPFLEQDKDFIQSNIRSFNIEPLVLEIDGSYYVSCCFWSDFEGLIRETLEVSISENRASFNEVDQKCLFEYSCGVHF